jgi:hypothetical protein
MGLLFTACQNEPIEEPVTTIAYKNILLQDLLATKIDRGAIEKSNKVNAINHYTNNTYGFFIDTQKGKYIQGATTTYTFPIYRITSNDKLENIVFKLNPSGNYSAYLVRYDITNKEFLLPTYNGHAKPIQCTLLSNIEKGAHTVKGWMDWDDFFHGQAPISGIPGDINPGGGDGSGGFIDMLMCNNNGYGDYGDSHTAGDNCNNSHFLYTVSVYTGNDYGSSYAGPGSIGTTPVGYGGEGSGGGASGNPILQASLLNIQTTCNITSDTYNWLSQNPDITKVLSDYLSNQPQITPEIVLFVKEIINAAISQINIFGNNSENINVVNDFIESVINSEKNINVSNIVIPPPSCQSFNFTNNPGSNWQSSAVANISFRVFLWTPGDGVYFNFEIAFPQPILFETPKNLLIGNTEITSEWLLHFLHKH